MYTAHCLYHVYIIKACVISQAHKTFVNSSLTTPPSTVPYMRLSSWLLLEQDLYHSHRSSPNMAQKLLYSSTNFDAAVPYRQTAHTVTV